MSKPSTEYRALWLAARRKLVSRRPGRAAGAGKPRQPEAGLYRAALENLSDAVFLTDAGLNLALVNSNAAALFGYSPQEIYAFGSLERLVGEISLDRETLQAHGGSIDVERRAYRRDGRELRLMMSVKALPELEDRLLFIFRDAAAQRLMDPQPQEALAALERSLKARTAQLQELSVELEERNLALEWANAELERMNTDLEAQAAELENQAAMLAARAADLERLNAELGRREARISEILNSTNDGFYALDRAWRFTYANGRAAHNAGFEPEDLLGAEIWLAFPNLTRTPLEAVYRRAMETGEPAHSEHHAEQTGRWYSVSAYPSQEGISVFWMDITDRKRAEAEREAHLAAISALSVQHAEARLRAEQMAALAQLHSAEMEAVFDAIADAVIVYDARGRPQRANPAAVAAYGFDPVGVDQEETAQRVSISYPDGRPVPEAELPTIRALHGRRVSGEHFVFTNDKGDELSLQASVTSLRSLGAGLDGLVAVWHDITDLERAASLQRRLLDDNLRQRDLLERLVREVPLGIALLRGREYCFTRVNPAYEALAPGRGELVGQTFAEVWPEADPQLGPRLDGVYESGEPFRAYEMPLKLHGEAGPQTAYFDFSITPLHDEAGRVEGLLVLVQDVTERVLARQESETQSTLLEAIITHAPEGIVVVDHQAQIIMTNPAADRLYARPVPYGKSFQEHASLQVCTTEGEPIDPRDLPLTRSALDGVTLIEQELVIVWPDGQVRPLVTSTAPLSDAQGRVTGAVGLFQDISERRRREEYTTFLHELGRELIELDSPDEVVGHTVRRVGGFLNAARCIIEELVRAGEKRRILAEYHDPRLPGLPGQVKPEGLPVKEVARLRAGLIVQVADIRALKLPEGYHELADAYGVRALLVAPWQDKAGEWCGSLAVTASKAREWRPDEAALLHSAADLAWLALENARLMDGLRLSEERFRVAFQNAPVFAAALDRELRYTWLYEPHRLGATPGDLGKTDEELGALENAAELAQIKRQVLESGLGVRREVTLRWTGGGKTVHDLTVEPLRGPDGRVEGLSMAGYDITQRKRMEERLEASHRELKDFAFYASHDLQEPLRKVQTFGARLEKEYGPALGETGRDYLQRMESAAARMQEMLKSLLAYSRIGNREESFQPVDLGQVAREVLVDLESRQERSGGRVEIGPLPTIWADPLQMRQLLQNLLSNALKFYRAGLPPEVRVYARALTSRATDVLIPSLPNTQLSTTGGEVERGGAPASPVQGKAGEGERAAGAEVFPLSQLWKRADDYIRADEYIRGREGWVEIVVEDNGIGFEAELAGRLFQPFQRLVGRGEYEGHGMGLAICRKIVERHGGRIRAQAEPGRGAVFTVTLPAGRA